MKSTCRPRDCTTFSTGESMKSHQKRRSTDKKQNKKQPKNNGFRESRNLQNKLPSAIWSSFKLTSQHFPLTCFLFIFYSNHTLRCPRFSVSSWKCKLNDKEEEEEAKEEDEEGKNSHHRNYRRHAEKYNSAKSSDCENFIF